MDSSIPTGHDLPATLSRAAQEPHFVERRLAEEAFETSVRRTLRTLRPNRVESLWGWREHRTRQADLAVTVSWSDAFGADEQHTTDPLLRGQFAVPRMADVIEALLIGSAVAQDDLTPQEECQLYRAVLGVVASRLEDLEASDA